MGLVIDLERAVEFRWQQGIDAHRIRPKSAYILKPAHIGIAVGRKIRKIFPRLGDTQVNAAEKDRTPFSFCRFQLEAFFYRPYIYLQLGRFHRRLRIYLVSFNGGENVMHEWCIHVPKEIAVVVHGVVGQHALYGLDAPHTVGGTRKL